jgi:hypothetical protein
MMIMQEMSRETRQRLLSEDVCDEACGGETMLLGIDCTTHAFVLQLFPGAWPTTALYHANILRDMMGWSRMC